MKDSKRAERFKGRCNGDAYEPTPAEIEAACSQIQARWSKADRKSRRVGGEPPQWTPAHAALRALDGRSNCKTSEVLDINEGD